MGMANGKTMAFALLAENRYGYPENHTDKLATKNRTRTAQRWMVTGMAERLTFDGNFCEIARCKETRWGKHCPDGACSQRKVWERLKQYEESDAIPVVKCKDCKYWQDNNDGYPHEECRWGHGETPDANDFCSYGERRKTRCD